MKKSKIRAIVGLIVLFVFSTMMTLVTTAKEASLVTVTLATDKDSYRTGETAQVRLSVANGNPYAIEEVKAEITLPEGVTLEKGSLASEGFTLAAGETKTEEISVLMKESGETNTKQSGSADVMKAESPKTGDYGMPEVWAVLAALSGMAVVVIGVKKKQGKRITALLLCCVIGFTSVPVETFAQEAMARKYGSVSAVKEVSLDGVKKEIKATVTYNWSEAAKETDADSATITFNTNDGTPVDPITVKKGEEAGRLPQSFKTGNAFKGWYSDAELTEPFFGDTVVTKDVTLYAAFEEVSDDIKISDESTWYEEDCAADKAFTLVCDEEITAENLNRYITVYAFTGDVPESFNVTPGSNNAYTVTPVGGYDAGCLYRVTAAEGVTFQGLEDTVQEYTFRIHKDESKVVDLEDNIKYVDRTKFVETEKEYEYKVSAEYFAEKALETGDTVCIGDGTTQIDEDTLFLNITLIEQSGNDYIVHCEDSNVEDVFDDVDVYFEETMENRYLQEGFDPQELEEELYKSEGVEQITMVLAAMLADSEEVKEELGGESLVGEDITMKDFSDTANPKQDTLTKLSVDLMEDLELSVEIGAAENDNFFNPDEDGWTVIVFTLHYEGTVMDRLLVDATFTISEYMNVSLQGYKSFEFEMFKTPQLEFDYAVNMYTQTDVEVKVLVCSTKKVEEGYKDISEKVTEMFSSNEENDTDGLVSEVKEMLESKGDYIKLCHIPFFGASASLAVFSLNVEFAFVVKVNFAAGLSSKLSVLDATQVGARGDSSTGKFEMYKNKMHEGDRYSFDLTVCGYLGIKMGVEGSLTVSFFGIKRLGEVGVALEVGAYLDMYGYARYHVVKPYSQYKTVYSTLYGGFYMEAGIYLETKLIARSAIFKVEMEVPLIPEQKWPLFTMGNKTLVLSINEIDTTMIFSSEGNGGSVDISQLPAPTARTLDITTGEIDDDTVIGWDKVWWRFSDRSFYCEGENGAQERVVYKPVIQYSSGYYDKKAETTAELLYLGQSLQFTNGAATDIYTVVPVKLLWYDRLHVDGDAIGKIFKVNFYKEVNGVKTLMETREVAGGDYAGACTFDDMYSSLYTNGRWDVEPREYVINKDTDFVYHMDVAQTRVIFIYFDDTVKKWKGEMRYANMGEIPSTDANLENDHMKVTGWNVQNGYAVGDCYKYAYVDDLLPLTGEILDSAITSGQSTQEIIRSTEGDSASDALWKFYEQNSEEYHRVAYFYTPLYEKEEMTVTYKYPGGTNGAMITDSFTVPYSDHFNSQRMKLSYPSYMKFKGFSSDGGKTLYKYADEMPAVYGDITYEAVCDEIYHNVTVQYFDDATNTYKEAGKYSVRHLDSLPKEYLEAAEKLTVWDPTTIHTGEKWNAVDENGAVIREFASDPYVVGDTVVRQGFNRMVRISLDAGDGELLFENYSVSMSSDDYKVKIGELAAKDSDNYNTYKLTGWKNKTTGEIYGVNEEVTIDKPVTLEAVYTPAAKTYTVNVTTLYGTLLNGKNTDSFSGGYDDYLEFMEKYDSFKPADVIGTEYTMKYANCKKDVSSDKLTVTINYNGWTTSKTKYKLSLDANGGTLTGTVEKTEDYGTSISLADMAVPTKTDPERYYTFSHWEDAEGNTYQADATITITKNLSLKAIWEPGEYKTYTVTYKLDGATLKTQPCKVGEEIPTPGTPEEADGYVFNGWNWSTAQSGTALAEKPERMPAMDLVVSGTTTKYSVIYHLDGKIYKSAEVKKIGSTVTLIDKPTLPSYDVSEWTADGITVTDNTFVMPEHDVVFKAQSSPSYYDINVKIDGKVMEGSPLRGQYTKKIVLPEIPEKTGYTAAWKSDDVTIKKNEDGTYGFTMTNKDITVECIYTQDVHNIYYVVDGEVYKIIEDVVAGTRKQIADTSDITTPDKEGYAFNDDWISSDLQVMEDKEKMFNMPSRDVFIYGYYYSASHTYLAINITSSDGKVSQTYYLFADFGATMVLPKFFYDGYTVEYSSDDVILDTEAGTMTMPTDTTKTEVNISVTLNKKS